MLRHPLVSVVTPSYNQGKFIEETIKSVLSQEGDFYLEYLIMDGGSKDNSVEIIKKYEGLLKRGEWPVKCRGIECRWVSEKDKGQSDAINKGFKKATGEIIAWLNSDDTYLPCAVNKMVSFFESNPDLMMVYGEGYEIDEKGEILRRFFWTQDFDLQTLIDFGDYILQPTVFMRKSAVEEVNFLDTGLNWAMDWDLWIKIGKKFKIGYMPEFIANSRIYGDTKTSVGGLKRFKELARLMRRHGKRRYTPGYVFYGYYMLEEIFYRKYPFLYRKILKYPLNRLSKMVFDFLSKKSILEINTHIDIPKG